MIETAPLGLADVPAIAAVHRRAFPTAAITRLGVGATERFYRSLLTGPHEADAWGAFVDARLVGYCFSGLWRSAEVYYVRNNAGFLATRLMFKPWLLAAPMFRSRIRLGLQLLVRPPAPSPAAPPRPPQYGIQSVAVDPAQRRSGIGRLLMEKAEASAREKRQPTINLTVHRTNEPAIRFYLGLGWEKVMCDGVWAEEMVKKLT